MVYLHKSLKGLAGILKDTCKNSKDRVILIELFDSLSKDVFIGSIIYGIPSFGLTVRELDTRPRKGTGSRKKLI